MTERDEEPGRQPFTLHFKALGARVRDIRVLRQMSQDEVANRAGIHRSRVSEIERGHQHSVETLFRLARALDVHPADLLDDRDEGGLLARLRRARKDTNPG